MAFCTNCGSTMDATAHFCPRCGKAANPAATTSAAAAAAPAQSYTPGAPQTYTPPPPSAGSSNVLKIILGGIAVFVVIGILCTAAMLYVVHKVRDRVRNGVHITQNGRDSVVDTPFGRATTSQTDARSVARQIGVDLYPGSVGGESSTAQFGSMTTASLKLTTSDSVDKVASFYKSRYPHAMVTTEGSDKFTLVSSENDGTLTLTAQSYGSETRIDIAKVGGLKINVQTR